MTFQQARKAYWAHKITIPKQIKCKEIRHLIQGYANRSYLCDTGIERLAWWMNNGHRFKSIRDGILTWSDAQITSYLHDQRIEYATPGQLPRAAQNRLATINQLISSLNTEKDLLQGQKAPSMKDQVRAMPVVVKKLATKG